MALGPESKTHGKPGGVQSPRRPGVVGGDSSLRRVLSFEKSFRPGRPWACGFGTYREDRYLWSPVVVGRHRRASPGPFPSV